MPAGATLRVISPADRISYPQMPDGSTEIRVRDDGTFGNDHHGDDDDDDGSGGGRRVRISSRRLAATNVDGRLRLMAASAPVVVNGARGELALEVGSGAVRVSGIQGSLSVETGSGDVAITAPADLSAQLAMETASGDIDTDFPLAVTGTAHGHLRGAVGDGKGKLSVETGSGGIRLLKGR